jgi:four helix bundle protein
MSESIIRDKSFAFALRIVRLYKYLAENRNEFVLSKSVLKSGTEIGAQVESAFQGLSRNDFSSHLAIALKEAVRTSYWLKLLHEGDFIDQTQFDSITADCLELIKLLTTAVKTSKANPS